jgi:hypothetical protein
MAQQKDNLRIVIAKGKLCGHIGDAAQRRTPVPETWKRLHTTTRHYTYEKNKSQ